MNDFKRFNFEDVVDPNETAEDGLLLEKQLINNSMKQFNSLFLNNPVERKQKNSKDSIDFRNLGNKLFVSKNHNTDTHNQIWDLYTKSIATAPNHSEELALAHGNRSAFLYHIKEFEESLKDCDEGMNITRSDFLKAKLLFRKVECHLALRKETTKSFCKEALETFEKFDLNADIKQKFIDKLISIMENDSPISSVKKKLVEKEEKLPTFPAQTEAPCASSAIAIKYNEKWGRHIVATRKIEPGEILVIEKSYLTSICIDGMYLYCSNCVGQTWASIPCTGCMYDVYCSNKCRTEAWKKFHKYECPVLSYLYNLNLDIYPFINQYKINGPSFIRALTTALKLLLISVYEVGGLEELRKELVKIESCIDPRTKGFSDNGVFESNKCRSVYSLTTPRDRMSNDNLGVFVTMVCIATYHLAKTSTFFGKKIDLTPAEMMSNNDIKFTAALLLKNTLLLPNNTLKYFVHRVSTILGQSYGAALYPFCSLINHSCDPNVRSIPTKNNERMVYSKRVIQEGEQLFFCYAGDNFTSNPKAQRNYILSNAYYFECECIACVENWPTFMPCVKDILKNTPTLKLELGSKLRHIDKLKIKVMSALKRTNYRYDNLMMKNVRRLMKEHSEHISSHSMDYEMFEHFIYMMLVNAYGTWLNIPDTC